MGKEVEEMNSVIDHMEKNDSKEVYINDDVSVNKKLSTYQYGQESSEMFKSAYSYEQMCQSLAEYSEFNVGFSQFSHPDSSSDEDQDS
eukprot:12187053-Ditylum_brightwellii.AAC.1